jgi:signal transduction histidine kinase
LSEERAPLSVTDVLESVQNIVQPMAEEKGLEVQLQPPMDDQRLGHALALSRVLLNLTTNSLKFTGEGFVEISAEPRGPLRLEFSVRDSGPGIPSDALLKLYQPFRREPGRPGYYFSGTGLGLVICRKLVAAMGSELRVETSPGWGTRFYFKAEMPPISL